MTSSPTSERAPGHLAIWFADVLVCSLPTFPISCLHACKSRHVRASSKHRRFIALASAARTGGHLFPARTRAANPFRHRHAELTPAACTTWRHAGQTPLPALLFEYAVRGLSGQTQLQCTLRMPTTIEQLIVSLASAYTHAVPNAACVEWRRDAQFRNPCVT